MLSFTRQLASLYSAVFPDLGVHDTCALKANDQGTTQGFHSFVTLGDGVQYSSDPPSNNNGLPRKEAKAVGSLQASAGIQNSNANADSTGSSEHVLEHIPGKLPGDEVLPSKVYQGPPAAEDVTNFPQPIVRRQQSDSFPPFLPKLADTKDPCATADQSSINEMKESLPQKTTGSISPPGQDSSWKEGNRLRSVSEKESPASPIRLSFTLDESIAKKMPEIDSLRNTQPPESLNLLADSRAQEPVSEHPDSTQELSPDVPPTLHSSTDPHCDCKTDLKTLQNLFNLQRAQLQIKLTEAETLCSQFELLKSIQEANILRLNVENLCQKVDLLKSAHEANTLRQENKASGQRISSLTEQLSTVTTELNNLTKEKQGWQGQLDAMQHRVQQAERQVRYLDNLTRLKLEAREDGAFGSVKRTKQYQASNQKPSTDVINLVVALNQVISQYAFFLTENVQRTPTLPYEGQGQIKRSNDILGSKVATRIRFRRQASLCSDFPPVLMQVILGFFMVHWCTQIIEGWYPKRKCFADVLLEFSQSTNSSTIAPGAGVDHGKAKILQTDVSTDYAEWASDIIEDLARLLLAGGVRMIDTKPLKPKFLTLVKLAYEVRTALAEKDLCGGLELLIVGSGMPFQHKWMTEEHPPDSNKSGSSVKMEPVAGTCGIGLQRVGKAPAISTVADADQIANVVLKPNVILEKVIDEQVP
ncbi:hypothetical protein CPC08DRAFT_750105 [Agrocybe pediades]|nr:hypothetical protein CPC08DRAFT_750105 [Agrocybe pediades]